MYKHNRGFGLVDMLIAVFLIFSVGFLSYSLYQSRQNSNQELTATQKNILEAEAKKEAQLEISTFEECTGYEESTLIGYPVRCELQYNTALFIKYPEAGEPQTADDYDSEVKSDMDTLNDALVNYYKKYGYYPQGKNNSDCDSINGLGPCELSTALAEFESVNSDILTSPLGYELVIFTEALQDNTDYGATIEEIANYKNSLVYHYTYWSYDCNGTGKCKNYDLESRLYGDEGGYYAYGTER